MQPPDEVQPRNDLIIFIVTKGSNPHTVITEMAVMIR
jgi:hypothetical protein